MKRTEIVSKQDIWSSIKYLDPDLEQNPKIKSKEEQPCAVSLVAALVLLLGIIGIYAMLIVSVNNLCK